jgi:GWxTD domain-containing protein
MFLRLQSVLFVLITLLLVGSGCGTTPRTMQEIALDDMYPYLSPAQYDSLGFITSQEGIQRFIEDFWQEVDSHSGLPPGSSKAEYVARLQYANDHFPDRRGYGRSDRKRIYMLYGPPKSITRSEFTYTHLGPLSTINAVEIWLYMEPQHVYSFPSAADDTYPSEMRFIFADLTGQGNYTLLFSGSDISDIDGRLFK